MEKVGFILILMLVAVSLLVVGCGGGEEGATSTPTATDNPTATQPTTTSVQPTKTPAGPAQTVAVSGQPRSENWLIGTWEATIPGTASISLAGAKVQMVITQVVMKQDETVQGNPVRLFAYSGALIFYVGGDRQVLSFSHANWPNGDDPSTLAWQSTGIGGQFMENMSLRVYSYPSTYDFELDWGPATSKSGSVWNSLDFYGTIWDRTSDNSAVFAPGELGSLKFTKIN